MKVHKNFYVPEVQVGDLIEFDDGEMYLVCPHPSERSKYYLPCLNGIGIYGTNGWTLQEVEIEATENQATIYSKEKYSLSLEEIK